MSILAAFPAMDLPRVASLVLLICGSLLFLLFLLLRVRASLRERRAREERKQARARESEETYRQRALEQERQRVITRETNHLAIVIEEFREAKGEKQSKKSLPQEASSSSSSSSSSAKQNKHEIQEVWPSLREETIALRCFLPLKRRLEESRRSVRVKGTASSVCIFRFPSKLAGINQKAQLPEIVSIGPYHRRKDHLLEFENYKLFFLDNFLSRTENWEQKLSFYLGKMEALEADTRRCYSDDVLMSSQDFVEMMLLDGCFIIEVLRRLDPGRTEDAIDDGDPIFTRPWLIPILIRDLLKLENQLPLFVLESLIVWSDNTQGESRDPLSLIALRVINQAFRKPPKTILQDAHLEAKHLLDLFRSSLLCSIPEKPTVKREAYRPSAQSMQCVTQLRSSGIKFKQRKADGILDIKFFRSYRPWDLGNWVLEIPSITVNDFTSTMLMNCVAMEECLDCPPKYFTDYISFMGCLISQPRDVTFLCSDGILASFHHGDQFVADFFNDLKKNVDFNVRESYFSEQIRDVEEYYSSHWASMMRTYFKNPWSAISVVYALLLLLLTLFQSFMAGFSYWKHRQ